MENGQYTTCVLANLPAEAVDSPRRADEIGSRLADLERILSESRASLAAAATADAEADRGALLHATLQRVARFTALLQSSLTRNDADAVDRLVVQLLLDDYTDIVHRLRASAADAAARLNDVAETIAGTERGARADRKDRKARS